jgi:hypothetical protein
MTAPQQFLASFLQERAEAYAEANLRLRPIYVKYFGEPLSEHAHDFLPPGREAAFEDVKQTAGSATLVTANISKARISARDTIWPQRTRIGRSFA